MKLKFFTILLAIPLMLVSCDKSNDTSPEDESGETPIPVVDGHYILNDGRSDYCIVLPSNATNNEKTAADRLIDYFYESTNVELPLKYDDDDSLTNNKIFSIGRTTFANNLGYQNSASKLKTTGFKLITNEESIYVVGSTDLGTIYGTFDLMHHLFGYEAYSIDEIQIDKLDQIQLLDFNKEFNPTIESVQCYEHSIINDNDYALLMNNLSSNQAWAKVGGRIVHTAPYLIPFSERESHPSWFGTDGNQLCYSEGIENDEMLNYLYNNLKGYIDSAPYAKYISVSQEDKATWCECNRCTASKERYGSNLAVMIKFVNKVADLVKRDYPNRELYVHTFSYHKTTDAIVNHLDEVTCRDNVTVMFAPIRGNYTKGFSDPTNLNLRRSLESIAKICSHVTLWAYSSYFPNYFVPYNIYTGLKDRIKIFSDNNVQFLFDQGEYDSRTSSFRTLRTYLISKLSYDISLNEENLINDFFQTYYGPASKSIRNYFEEWRSWDTYCIENLGKSYDINASNVLQTKFWPYNTLKQWEQYFNQAYKDIDYLKYTDEQLFNKYNDRIRLESMSVRYMLIQLYGDSYYQQDELFNMRSEFKNDCYKFGITNSGEGRSMETIYTNWGI